ncbi:MAG: type II toxin-antitoxin system PrlF family antitoxin [Thermodesulfovibrionales bacterium]|jgi:AbrB family looped-hinge helix DNA binding protein
MPASVITSKGQTTIPKKIRDHLNLHPGDRVDFVIGENGRVIIEPATLDAGELEGILSRPGIKAVSVEEMKKTIRERFRDKQ